MSDQAPADVADLAARRAAARADGDFVRADELREQIGQLGWVIRDGPGGFTVAPAPPYPLLPSVAALPDRTSEPDRDGVTVGVLVDGWPTDLRTCLAAAVRHAPAAVTIVGLDLGNVDGAGEVLHELATAHPDRVRELHVAAPAGWAAARRALLAADTAAVHVWLEPSTVLTGDALSPVLDALADPTVAGAGWRGVDADEDWLGFHDSGPGEVDAILGYLFAMRRRAVQAAGGGPDPKARFYRNADLEFSFALRDAGRAGGCDRLVVPAGALPVHQGRHRGYHDTDPDYRDRESRRNYDRFLRRYRGRADLRRRPSTG